MAYTSTYDEKSTGFFSTNASSYYDAPFSLNTNFYIAAGSVNAAYGLLGSSGYSADTDTYKMGTLATGTYTVSAASGFWFYGAGYVSYVTPTVGVYNSSGTLISGGGVTNTSFTVNSSGDYYIAVTGVTYASSQYSVSYTYTPPINYPANSGSLAISGTLAVGNVLSITGNFSDANGVTTANTSNGYVYTWYVSADNINWSTVSTGSTYRVQTQDVGKYIDCLITFRDDAGNSESVSPPGLLIPAAVLSPTYRLSPATSSMNEGTTDNIALQTTNLSTGSTVTYAITGVAANRISTGVLSGTVTVDANGQAVIPFSVINNNQTDGATTAVITIGNNLASTSVSIIDSSLTPTTAQVSPVSKVAYAVSSPNLTISGTSDVDAASFIKTKASVTIKISGTQTSVVDSSGTLGTTVLNNIERLQFTDTMVALDIGKDQTAGSGYMLYKAAFNRTPDAGGLGYWISKMDAGASFSSVAQSFVNSAEFKTAFGGSNPSVNTLVTKLYNNVLNRTPDAGGLAFWQDKLNTGWSTADVLGFFSTSGENVTNVTPLIANGIQYQQFVG
jgi:hypothetical protein